MHGLILDETSSLHYADDKRRKRGERLFAEGAVLDCSDRRRIIVRGSTGNRYTVRLTDPTRPDCDCPDWWTPWCKHVVAATLALEAKAAARPQPVTAQQMYRALDEVGAADTADQRTALLEQLAERLLDAAYQMVRPHCENPYGTCGGCCSYNIDRLSRAEDAVQWRDRSLAAMLWLHAHGTTPIEDRGPLQDHFEQIAGLIGRLMG